MSLRAGDSWRFLVSLREVSGEGVGDSWRFLVVRGQLEVSQLEVSGESQGRGQLEVSGELSGQGTVGGFW